MFLVPHAAKIWLNTCRPESLCLAHVRWTTVFMNLGWCPQHQAHTLLWHICREASSACVHWVSGQCLSACRGGWQCGERPGAPGATGARCITSTLVRPGAGPGDLASEPRPRFLTPAYGFPSPGSAAWWAYPLACSSAQLGAPLHAAALSCSRKHSLPSGGLWGPEHKCQLFLVPTPGAAGPAGSIKEALGFPTPRCRWGAGCCPVRLHPDAELVAGTWVAPQLLPSKDQLVQTYACIDTYTHMGT